MNDDSGDERQVKTRQSENVWDDTERATIETRRSLKSRRRMCHEIDRRTNAKQL